MESTSTPESFLEPVYLNEKMVLNCAAYVFKGYSVEADEKSQTQNDRSRAYRAGFKYLQDLVSIGVDAQSKQVQTIESKSSRRYTVGGLHMTLIDELHDRGMLTGVDPDSLESDILSAPSHVEMMAELRPIDFYALVENIRTTLPIITRLLTSIVKPIYDEQRRNNLTNSSPMLESSSTKHAVSVKDKKNRSSQPKAILNDITPDRFQLFLQNSESYLGSLGDILKSVEDDYRRSKQLEMVMWSTGIHSRPFGVIDLELGDYGLEELRSKLSGGRYHVIGKVTRVVSEHDSMSLLQKSNLFGVLSLVDRAIEAYGEAESLTQYRGALEIARHGAERLGLLEVPGPAVRVTAMSVCI